MVRTCCVFSCTFPPLAYYYVFNTIFSELVGLNKEGYMCAALYFNSVLTKLGMLLKQIHTVLAALSNTDFT
jgi:hypothetical protein